MQLTGPVYLLVFLPLSVLAALPFKRQRALVLALLSILWYGLANFENPFGIIHIFTLTLAVLLLARLPHRHVGTVIGITLTLGSLIAARCVAEYTTLAYTYPQGLTLLTISTVSYLCDRGEARAATVPETVAYLLFYPALTMGPVIRFSEFLPVLDAREDSLERFSRGIHLYAMGFIKRIGCAAILLRTLENIFSHATQGIPHQMMLLILPVAYFLLYFTVTGNTSMARGVALMYGLELPRDHLPLFEAIQPDKMPRGMFCSLGRFLDTYVGAPIGRILPGRAGRLTAGAATFALGVFFFRLRPSLLLLACPILLYRLWRVFPETPRKAPRRLPGKILLGFFSFLLCAVFVTGMILPEPIRFYELFRVPNVEDASYRFYYIYGTVSWTTYLIVGAAAVLAFVPLSHLYSILRRRVSGKGRLAMQIVESVTLFAAFFVTIVYFLPQFPEYAEKAFTRIYI